MLRLAYKCTFEQKYEYNRCTRIIDNLQCLNK